MGAASEDEQPDGTVSETENGAGEAAVKNEKDPVAGKEKPPQETGTQSPPNDKPKATKTKPRKNTVPASKKTEPGSGADFGATASDDKAKKPADKPDAEQQKSAYPGLPRRKPPKPNVRRIPLDQAVSRKKTPSGRDRDAYLCQSLQACRNDFIKCKSKIKHPDQSQAWIDEKEACGAVYKKCVQQHFKPGEWFFTRWFYFQELDCK